MNLLYSSRVLCSGEERQGDTESGRGDSADFVGTEGPRTQIAPQRRIWCWGQSPSRCDRNCRGVFPPGGQAFARPAENGVAILVDQLEPGRWAHLREIDSAETYARNEDVDAIAQWLVLKGDCCVERLPRSHLCQSRASRIGDQLQPFVSAHDCIRVRLPGAGGTGRLVRRQLAANHFWTAMAEPWTSISGLSERTGAVVCGHRCGGDFGWTQRPPDASIAFLLPQTQVEMTLWMVVSTLAGISEEAIYRGYLQKQFAASTGSLPVGILISAAAFGAVHVYQGWSRATLIAISAILFGVVAHWRRTVRPGMFAHGLQDAIAPLLLKLLRH